MIIQALIYDGFDELDLIGVYEPLRMANLAVTLRTLHEQETVTGSHGLRIKADGILNLEDKPDILLVPGGGWLSRATCGAWVQSRNQVFLDTLISYHKAGVILASVCTGSLLLAKAGLLKGRMATTNHEAIKELLEMKARAVAARVVDDGNIITAGGVTSSLDLGLWLVKRFVSERRALNIAQSLEFEPREPSYRNGEICKAKS